ncbi:MAG: PadR family transcriptional regulator [Candidatus Riflebacteria bacterium HGW-Riflebacteria-2]|jgi:PadR family transcriptional regulator PadR|nr:MAG: PadR family transcriptional regulator [Candidatus Riflebacteria bacterium HGW-Riflebacteria-2]
MNSQFRKGVLEMCILALIARKDCYGYEIIQEISLKMDITKGTVYPLLSRLKSDELFENYIRESTEGPARKYYRITEKGRNHVTTMIDDYLAFNEKVLQIIKA